jgi:predicted TIM-barrel fold metal-dependent hydrolase
MAATAEAIVEPFMTETFDADGHEMAPLHLWGEIFGEAANRLSVLCAEALKKTGGNNFHNPELAGDLAEINYENVWNVRGTGAPGAFDFDRRLDVLDEMHIRRQLIFPSFGFLASKFIVASEYKLREQFGLDLPSDEIRALGRRGVAEYNVWAARMTKRDPDRLRCVGYLSPAASVAELVDAAKDLMASGIRTVNIPPGRPPAGVSPAAEELDVFWDLLESNDVPLTLHVGNEDGFLAASEWGKAPAFKFGKVESHELGLEPYTMANIHVASSHFLSVMVLGGVFERFPRLRFGAIEQGASWIAPLARNLDMWARDVYATRLRPFISMLPSEYLARNVRVTPFNNFEPIDEQFRQNPDLASCYCYSTDYPHIEGGKDIQRVFESRMAPLGSEVAQKFFVENARWIMPDLLSSPTV